MRTPFLLGTTLLTLAWAATAAEPAPGAATADHGGHPSLYASEKITWKDGPPSLPPGAKIAVLEGDPSKEGMFVFRVKVPDGYHIPAHTHPKHERVTIIQGTFRLAMGAQAQEKDAQDLPTGTYGVWPPGMIHAVWTKGETVVQFHGTGPWVINYVNPAEDPRNAKK